MGPRGADADGVWMHRPYPPKHRIIVVLTLIYSYYVNESYLEEVVSQ